VPGSRPPTPWSLTREAPRIFVVRVALFVLLALNLLYLAWSGWIDSPEPPPVASHPAPALPRLALGSEQQPPDQTQLVMPADAAAQVVSATGEPGMTARASRCVSVGPFNDLAHAARGAALLHDRGFDPKQRAEEGETWEGYWVYVGGLDSAAEETKVLKTLERAGISDAHAMPEASDGRRVSVGLFSERGRAEKRAQGVKRLGFTPQIVERRQPGTVYWVDLDLGVGDRTVPTEGLLSIEDAGARLEIRVCPAASPPAAPAKPLPLQRDARPAATTADDGSPKPG
jgi:SPOR domain